MFEFATWSLTGDPNLLEMFSKLAYLRQVQHGVSDFLAIFGCLCTDSKKHKTKQKDLASITVYLLLNLAFPQTTHNAFLYLISGTKKLRKNKQTNKQTNNNTRLPDHISSTWTTDYARNTIRYAKIFQSFIHILFFFFFFFGCVCEEGGRGGGNILFS